MALRCGLAVVTLAMCFLYLSHAEAFSAAGFYASVGYRPAFQNIGKFTMSVNGCAADVFVPGLDACCGPMEAREVDSHTIEKMRSARAAAVTYSSDYAGMFGVLGAVNHGFRLELKVARSFFGVVRTGGDALIDYKDVLLVQEMRPTANGAAAPTGASSAGSEGTASQRPSTAPAPITGGLVAVHNRGIGGTAAMVSVCYDADEQFTTASFVPHFCVGSGIDAVNLFDMTRAAFSVEGSIGFHQQLSESMQLVISAFVHRVLDSTFNDVPIAHQWGAYAIRAAARASDGGGDDSRRSLDLRVSDVHISYLGAEIGLRWFFQ